MNLRVPLQRASSRAVRVVLLACALGALGDCRAQSHTGDALALVRAQMQRQQWAEAEAALHQHLAADPRSAEAMYLLGRVLQSENKPKESLTWFTHAAAITRPSAEELRVVALDYVLLADYADAVRWLNESLKADPRNSEAWYDLARARMMQGDFRGAEAPLVQALNLHPGSVKAENNLGLVFEAENRPSDALAAYRKAIEWQGADPHPSEQPLLNYGTLLVEQQKGTEAIPVLEKAIALAPREVKAHEQLARALDQIGDLPHAISAMQQAIAMDSQNPRLHYQLGQIYRHAGNADAAKQELALSGKLYGTKSSEPAQP